MKTQRIYSVIPIEERLPKNDGAYIGTTSQKELSSFYICDGFIYGPITHWLEEKEALVFTPEELREEMEDFATTCMANFLNAIQGDGKYKSVTSNVMIKELYDIYLKSKEQ